MGRVRHEAGEVGSWGQLVMDITDPIKGNELGP